MEIQQAKLADIEVALSLLERFFAEEGFDVPQEQIREQLEALLCNRGSAVFLAWERGQAIGVATVTTTQGIELGLSAELEDLYVLPDVRGTGAGRVLIRAVGEWCRARGCSLVAVVVTPEGQAAHDLISYYQAQGFEETGRTLLFYHLARDRS
jgi:aminoglycoside 6'-N-acetyltransferase I